MKTLRAAIVMAWYTPYRVPLFRELARTDGIDLTVIFCSEIEPGRAWSVPEELPFKAIFLRSRRIVRYTYRRLYGEENSIRYPSGLYRALRTVNPDIVVGYEFRPECMLAAMYSLFARCAYISWSDTTGLFNERLGRVRRDLRKLLLARSNSLIGSSSDTIDHFCTSFGYPATRSFLSILSAHVDELAATVRNNGFARGFRDGVVRFIYVGRLSAIKGVDLLVRAFAVVAQRLANVRLTIVGDGPELDTLKGLARDLGCGDLIDFEGYIAQPDLTYTMASHDVFVFPSRLDVFGLAVAEAIACGLPVICSRFAGVARDMVHENGVVVNPEHPAELASAMEMLALDAGLRARMAEANQPVLLRHNLRSAVQGFLSALEKAASG